MKFKRVVIFTKTNWDEPPRIRHQLTKLLLENKHQVVFFEKSNFKQFKIIKYIKDNILFFKHFELLHHQLRPFGFMVKINAMVTKFFIKKALKNEKIDLIINFNYDYYFLKEMFSDLKIVTIINDDFVAQARPWMIKSIKQQLKQTCENSDLVFAVSYPLQEQLAEFNKNTKLFFPWTFKKYEKPTNNINRNVVLYWGYIDHRIDWKIIKYLLEKGIKLRFIGMVSHKVESILNDFNKFDNFELLKPTKLEDVYLDDISCSILSYVNTSGEMIAVTVNNRVFQLLSYGIPLVYVNLPNLIKTSEKVIKKCTLENEYFQAIKYFENNFYDCQDDIESFLGNHYSEKRYEYLLKSIEEI